jgi:hypothetical protein
MGRRKLPLVQDEQGNGLMQSKISCLGCERIRAEASGQVATQVGDGDGRRST